MAKGTWVVIDQRDGKIRKVSLELISKACEFGDEVAAVIMGQGVEGLAAEAGKAGADKVYLVDDAKFAVYNTGAYAAQLAALAKKYEPATILFGHSAMGKDLAPRAAQKLDTGLVTDCTDVEASGGKLTFTRPIYAGKAFAKVSCAAVPAMATIRANIFDVAEAGKTPEVIKADVAVTDADLYQTIKEFIPTVSSRPELTEANYVVSGGRGAKGAEGFKLLEELADIFGAAVGASRAAIDSGWIDNQYQVGQTGKVVNPILYVAAGISGAIQHVAGMSSSKNIVSINKDPEAPIFAISDFGVVGDMFAVVPEMIKELKK
ncbi:MAG: electron transfer flavoprotein subunit alpha/FixB family protein [Syntrophomonadaceae bacterium]|nr:electron transfer flavoprotein subunit alpha/FixB family protein [Syntrophomonadaceae bacterium]